MPAKEMPAKSEPQQEVVPQNLPRTFSLPFKSLLVALGIVLATGLVAGWGRVEFASPFLARQAAVKVTFYDSLTDQVVPTTPATLLPLALDRRLGHRVDIFSIPPPIGLATLQSLLAWLCVWVALGASRWVLRLPFTSSLWWQLGVTSGVMSLWRLLQALFISHWLWLPGGRPDLVAALLDLTMGMSVPSPLLWGVLWRGAGWLLMGLGMIGHLFFVFRWQWQCSRRKALLGTLLTFLIARLLYALPDLVETL